MAHCQYCDWSAEIGAGSASSVSLGGGAVNYYSDLGKYLCSECNNVSTELVHEQQEETRELTIDELYAEIIKDSSEG